MTDAIPSAAAVVYAAADLFATPTQGRGYPVPCTTLKVVEWELGVQLICVTLCDMIRQGLITLQVAQVTKLLVVHTQDVVVYMAPDAGERMPRSGLGWWLGKSIHAHNGESIHNIIRAAYGQDYVSPYSVLTEMVSQELVRLDFYQDTVQEIGGIGGMLRKAVHASTTKHVLVPIGERFATLRTWAPSVQQMLQSVISHDPVLWEMLRKQIGQAIASRERDDTSSSDSFNSPSGSIGDL